MFSTVWKWADIDSIDPIHLEFPLKVQHITLSKYARMIDSANLHDDLDVVTSVYLPESKWSTVEGATKCLFNLRLASFNIQHPSFNENYLNPNERVIDISANYS